MDLLEDISPWWWVALAILLAAAEMVTVTTVLVWSAGAALVTALALWAAPGLGGAQQIALFGALSIAFTFAGRWLVDRFGRRGDGVKLNRRAEQLVGRDGVVLVFEHGEGKVDVDGVPWPARLEGPARTPAPGERVRVVAADGIVVWVRPL
jgi:membrane protein implicated in regulation of membrane protease activity